MSYPLEQNQQDQDEQLQQFFQDHPLFDGLTNKLRDDFSRSGLIKTFPAGETVYTIGQNDGLDVMFLIDGEARLTQTSENGSGMSVEMLQSGDAVGLEWAISRHSDQALKTSLDAESDLSLVLLETQMITQAVQKNPRFARTLLAYFAEKILTQRTDKISSEDSIKDRLYHVLFDMLTQDQVNNYWQIESMPKHRELSELTGATEREAAEVVASLISDGIARRNYPGLIVTDYPAFYALAKNK
ncbi:MAG: Crp/Fnr family transcriptional regulator [bacterium]